LKKDNELTIYVTAAVIGTIVAYYVRRELSK